MKNKTLYILLCVLLFATIGNIIVHYQMPSYRFYKREFETVKNNMVQYTNSVNRVFALAVSNLFNQVSLAVQNSGSILSATNVVSSEYVDLNKPVNIKFDFYLCGKFQYVRVNGWDYREGDKFRGEIIEYISPDSFKTTNTIYWNTKEVGSIVSSFPINNAPSQKNFSVPKSKPLMKGI